MIGFMDLVVSFRCSVNRRNFSFYFIITMNPSQEYTLPCTSWLNRFAHNLIIVPYHFVHSIKNWYCFVPRLWLVSLSLWHTLSISIQSELDELEELGHQPAVVAPELHYHPLVSSESTHSISDKENWSLRNWFYNVSFYFISTVCVLYGATSNTIFLHL